MFSMRTSCGATALFMTPTLSYQSEACQTDTPEINVDPRCRSQDGWSVTVQGYKDERVVRRRKMKLELWVGLV